MMKILKNLFFIAVIFVMTACAGEGSYSSEKCAALQEKINSKEEMTDADYTEMVDQLGAIVYYLKDKQDEIGDDKEKEKEYAKSTEVKEMLGYFFAFGMYIDSHHDQLSNSNKRKINKIMEEFKQEQEKNKN